LIYLPKHIRVYRKYRKGTSKYSPALPFAWWPTKGMEDLQIYGPNFKHTVHRDGSDRYIIYSKIAKYGMEFGVMRIDKNVQNHTDNNLKPIYNSNITPKIHLESQF